MTWLSLVLALVKLAQGFVSFLSQRRLISAGEDRAVREQLEATNDAVRKAIDARRAADARNADPERLRDDDGFRRDE